MKEVVNQVAEKFELTKKFAEEVVDTVAELMAQELASTGKLRVTSLGSFVIREKASYLARNPNTNEAIQVPARKAVKFTPSKKLKESI